MSDMFQRRYGDRVPTIPKPPIAQDVQVVRGNKVLRAIFANAGIEAAYKRKIQKLIDEMNQSICYWLTAAYRANEPKITQDALPATELRKALRRLGRRWQRRFNDMAPELALYFSKSIYKRSSKQLEDILRKGGIAVEFKLTDAQRDILRATIEQNVSLIKSIPQQYLQKVEGMVMRSVQTGRDLNQLTKDLQKEFKITRRRATLISRDQNNKATAALTRARHLEIGIKEAIWLHSHAGKKPRPQHVKMDGKKYNIEKGMWDPVEKAFILPGQLINCRCTSRPVVAGFS